MNEQNSARQCVWFKGYSPMPLNSADDINHISCGSLSRVGDMASIRLEDGSTRTVGLLRSSGSSFNPMYLVDVENQECWPFDKKRHVCDTSEHPHFEERDY